MEKYRSAFNAFVSLSQLQIPRMLNSQIDPSCSEFGAYIELKPINRKYVFFPSSLLLSNILSPFRFLGQILAHC